MRTSQWKNVEREVAKLLGAERVPITGRTRGSAPDAKHPTLSIEIKHRKEIPAWMHAAMEQAEASVRGEQTPIVVLHENRQRYQDSFVVVRLSDFQKLLGLTEDTDS